MFRTFAALCIAYFAVSPAPAADTPFVILRNGTLYDGTGGPTRRANIALREGRIVEIGKIKATDGAVVIDCTGLIIAPGFIDLHSHSDNPLRQSAMRANLNFLMQGATTVVTGNCGSGPIDVAAYYGKLKEGGIGTNVAHQIPHNELRCTVMGNANRPPTDAELKKMEALVDQGMKDGAWSMATGLIYNPGTYSKTDELIALAKVVSRHGGFYASHIRNEGVNVLVATDEALTIGKEAQLPVHISHMKASGRRAWGMAADQMAMVQKARKKGQLVTGDQYPYTASSTSLSATVIPPRFREGSRKDFLDRLDDAEVGPRLRQGIAENIKEKDDGRAIRIASYAPNREWQGKTLADLAKARKKEPLDLVIEIERNGGAGIVNFGINDEDMRLIMKNDFVATASDGSSQVPADTVPHPRSYGTFPRKIGRFAIEEGVLSLEQAIRSASGLPADILHIKDRGYLRKGYVADVVVFDPKTFRDTATFDQPHQYATGVVQLFVNGAWVIKDKRFTGTLAGVPLVCQEHTRPETMKRGSQPGE